MTTDAVGVIIPKVVEQFQLSMTEAAAFHYVPMIFIGFSGLFLGRLADRVGRKKVILAGLALYTLACIAFAFGESFLFYLMGAVLRRDAKKDKHSMIIHATKKNIEQGQIYNKILALLNHFNTIDLSSDILKNSKTKEIYNLFKNLYTKEKENLEIVDDSEKLFKQMIKVSGEVALIKLNHESDLNNLSEQTSNLNYFIIVGGDMLDRGLTIEGLAVNYFTREPVKGQIDTMLQRARWFGYKTEYKKFCRVYLTKGVSNIYSSIIESEDDLWAQLKIIENSTSRVKDLDINIYVPSKNLKPTSSSKVKVAKTTIKPWFVW
jgi:hypothetical protein